MSGTGFVKPVFNAPMVDLRTGRINIQWWQWLLTIDAAVGGSGGNPPISAVSDLVFDTPNTSGQIAQVEARTNAVETLLADSARREPANLSVLFGQVNELTTLTMGLHNPIQPRTGIPGTIVSSTVLAGAAIPVPNNTTFDLTHIPLTAGTWLVYANIVIAPGAGTTVSVIEAWTSTSSATPPTAPNAGAQVLSEYAGPAGTEFILPVGMQLMVVPGAAAAYLSAFVTWAVAQPSAYGFIGAIRLI